MMTQTDFRQHCWHCGNMHQNAANIFNQYNLKIALFPKKRSAKSYITGKPFAVLNLTLNPNLNAYLPFLYPYLMQRATHGFLSN
jgi:hypothetical protein